MEYDCTYIILYGQYGQLVALQQQIQAKIDGQNAVDIGYWEALLQQLKAHLARARLRDRHQAMLRKKLFQLKVEVIRQVHLVAQIIVITGSIFIGRR